MTTLNQSIAIPAISKMIKIRAQQQEVRSAAEVILQGAEKAGRDLLPAEQARVNVLTAQSNAFGADLDRQLAMAGAAIPDGAHLSVSDNIDADPHRGFRSFGDFSRAVADAAFAGRQGRAADPRIAPLRAAAPGTLGNEGSGVDGGILVPSGFANRIFRLSLDEESLLPLTDEMQLDGNGMLLPKDETTPWSTNGIQAYWQAEGKPATPQKSVFTGLDLRLKKLLALVPVSNELLSDSSALSSYMPSRLASAIRWKTNDALLFGSGAGVPLGALNSPSAITVSKDGGQASATLSATNLVNMIARMPPGSYPRAVWLINNDVLPALWTLTLGNYPIYMPGGSIVGGFQTSPYGLLLGRPIIVSQHAKSFSNAGDISILDMFHVQTVTKAEGITTATSIHLYFDADATAFRTSFRLDGAPKLTAPIAPFNGFNTLSPFVRLGAR